MNIETLKVFLAKKKLERDKMQAHKGRATSLSYWLLVIGGNAAVQKNYFSYNRLCYSKTCLRT